MEKERCMLKTGFLITLGSSLEFDNFLCTASSVEHMNQVKSTPTTTSTAATTEPQINAMRRLLSSSAVVPVLGTHTASVVVRVLLSVAVASVSDTIVTLVLVLVAAVLVAIVVEVSEGVAVVSVVVVVVVSTVILDLVVVDWVKVVADVVCGEVVVAVVECPVVLVREVLVRVVVTDVTVGSGVYTVWVTTSMNCSLQL
jgi:hypothetical protein